MHEQSMNHISLKKGLDDIIQSSYNLLCVYCSSHAQNNGKVITWKHLQDLYAIDSGSVREQPGLAMVPKLKYEHVHLNSFSKMRVDLAAQVSVHVYMYFLKLILDFICFRYSATLLLRP